MKNLSKHFMDQLREYSSYPTQASAVLPSLKSEGNMNVVLTQLQKAAGKFARMAIEQRIELAKSIQNGYVNVAERSVQAGCVAKGITLGSPAEAEEWATGPRPRQYHE